MGKIISPQLIGKTSGLILWLLLFVIFLSGVSAQVERRAAVVVEHGNGRLQTACVTFNEPQISGLELLQRANLSLEVAEQAGSAAVCGIEGTGCPAEDCFCACRSGADCQFWNYAHQNEGAWQFSSVGASHYAITNGAVDGWRWGNNGSLPTAAPSFLSICSPEKSYLPLVYK